MVQGVFFAHNICPQKATMVLVWCHISSKNKLCIAGRVRHCTYIILETIRKVICDWNYSVSTLMKIECMFVLIKLQRHSHSFLYLKSSSMSRTLAISLSQAFSFNWSSFILLFIVIVFLVIFFPGLLILNIQGSHCKNTLFTWNIKLLCIIPSHCQYITEH